MDRKKLLPHYIDSMQRSLAALKQHLTSLETDVQSHLHVWEVRRLFHSMNTGSCIMQYSEIAEVAAREEDVFAELHQTHTFASLEQVAAAMGAIGVIEKSVLQLAEELA